LGKEKECQRCFVVKPLAEFNKIHCENRPHPYCKICHNQSSRDYAYKKKYNLSIQDVYKKLKKQKYSCLICTKYIDKDSFVVDHNHLTNKVRGLLCRNCNTGLGFFKDRIDLLSRAVVFLYEQGSYGIQDISLAKKRR
jgi:hypothetical protein